MEGNGASERQGGETTSEGAEKEERSYPGQAMPGVRVPGGEATCPVSSTPSVHRSQTTVFHSTRLAGLPCASRPLGSPSMSGGGGRWRKQLRE